MANSTADLNPAIAELVSLSGRWAVVQEPPFVIPRIEAAANSYAFLDRLTA